MVKGHLYQMLAFNKDDDPKIMRIRFVSENDTHYIVTSPHGAGPFRVPKKQVMFIDEWPITRSSSKQSSLECCFEQISLGLTSPEAPA